MGTRTGVDRFCGARVHVDEPFVLAMADHIFEQDTLDAFLDATES